MITKEIASFFIRYLNMFDQPAAQEIKDLDTNGTISTQEFLLDILNAFNEISMET